MAWHFYLDFPWLKLNLSKFPNSSPLIYFNINTIRKYINCLHVTQLENPSFHTSCLRVTQFHWYYHCNCDVITIMSEPMSANTNNSVVSQCSSVCYSFCNIFLVLFLGMPRNMLLNSVHYISLWMMLSSSRDDSSSSRADRVGQIQMTNQMNWPTCGLLF